jgi:catechol-2,3-dioxygenase
MRARHDGNVMSTSPQGNIAPVAPAARPIDPGVTIGHVHLRTSDIDRVRDFYVACSASTPLRQTADHVTHLAIYISDPDGNDLELCWDRPFDEWPRDALEHLRGEMGEEVDLDALLAEASQ